MTDALLFSAIDTNVRNSAKSMRASHGQVLENVVLVLTLVYISAT